MGHFTDFYIDLIAGQCHAMTCLSTMTHTRIIGLRGPHLSRQVFISNNRYKTPTVWPFILLYVCCISVLNLVHSINYIAY